MSANATSGAQGLAATSFALRAKRPPQKGSWAIFFGDMCLHVSSAGATP